MTDTLAETLTANHESPATTPITLLGIGTASPPAVSQKLIAAEAERFACTTDQQRAWLKRVFLRCGIDQRGFILKKSESDTLDEARRFYPNPTSPEDFGPTTATRLRRFATDAPPLAQRAAAQALANSGRKASEVTHLITVSCTGFFAPGLDVEMITRLGLPPSVHRLHLGFMGCHAAFNALASAADALRADPEALILICCIELCTLHFAYGFDPQKLVANALFADGASACIVGAPDIHPDGHGCHAQRGPMDPSLRSNGTSSPPEHASTPRYDLLHAASLLLPESRDAMTWTVGDHGFEMTLSAELPNLIQHHLRTWCESWLAKLDLTLADITHWAIHPGGPKIIEAAANSLGLAEPDLTAARTILAEHGNMSSATLLFLLEQLAQPKPSAAELPKRGLTLAVGFGPGLMAEALLLNLT